MPELQYDKSSVDKGFWLYQFQYKFVEIISGLELCSSFIADINSYDHIYT